MENRDELIAGFLGFTKTDEGWYDNKMLLPQIAYDRNGGNCFNELEFYDSWDWIHPALQEIREYIDGTPNGDSKYDAECIWSDLVATFDMGACYEYVVEFIEKISPSEVPTEIANKDIELMQGALLKIKGGEFNEWYDTLSDEDKLIYTAALSNLNTLLQLTN